MITEVTEGLFKNTEIKNMRKDDERLSLRMKGAPAPLTGEGLVWLGRNDRR